MELALFGLRIFLDMPSRSIIILLLLDALVVVSYFFMIRIREKRVIKFGNFETLKRIEGAKRFSISPALLIFKIVIITLLFLVATNSIKLNIMKKVSNTDFVLGIDTSASMLTPDYDPDRLGMAKKIALKWLKSLPDSTRVGVVTFADNVTRVLEPTMNFAMLKRAVNNINSSSAGGGTSLGKALLTAASMVKDSPKQKAVVIITDGRNNEGIELNSTLNKLNDDKISVYSIGIGNNNKTIEFYNKMKRVLLKSNLTANTTYEIPEVDAYTLQLLANKTRGKFFIVRNESSLENAFSHIFLNNEMIRLDSDYYILLFLAFIMVAELLMFAKYGAI